MPVEGGLTAFVTPRSPPTSSLPTNRSKATGNPYLRLATGSALGAPAVLGEATPVVFLPVCVLTGCGHDIQAYFCCCVCGHLLGKLSEQCWKLLSPSRILPDSDSALLVPRVTTVPARVRPCPPCGQSALSHAREILSQAVTDHTAGRLHSARVRYLDGVQQLMVAAEGTADPAE